MKLVYFTSAKGGVGTSFVLSCIAYALAKMGKRCLAADLHCGSRTLDLYMGTDGEFVFDMQDVFQDSCGFEDAVVRVNDSIDFISCSQEQGTADYQAVTDLLKKSCADYDYVLLDCPYEYMIDLSANSDSMALVVTSCDKASVRCTEKLIYDMPDGCEKYLVINNIIPEFIQNGYHNNVDDICDICGVAPIGLIPYEPLAVTGDAKLVMESGSQMVEALGNTALRIDGDSVIAVNFKGKTLFNKLMKKYSRRND